jgi:hypothetical protein
MRAGHVVVLAALALGCGKKKDGDQEKVGRPAPVTEEKGGEGVPGGGATVAGTCAKLDALAKSEGGDALEKYKKELEPDCAKNLGEEKARMGDEAWGKFSLCIADKTTLTAALGDCEP